MNWISPVFIIMLASGIGFMIIGGLLLKFPQPHINSTIGYRTRASMKSKERWDFAQRYSMRQMIVSGMIAAILSPVGVVVRFGIPADYFVGIGCILLFAFLPIARTEIALRKRFNGSAE